MQTLTYCMQNCMIIIRINGVTMHYSAKLVSSWEDHHCMCINCDLLPAWLKLRVGPTRNGGHGLLWNAQVIKVRVYEYACFCSESMREMFQHNIQKSRLIHWLLIKAWKPKIFGLAKCKLDTVEPYVVWSALWEVLFLTLEKHLLQQVVPCLHC